MPCSRNRVRVKGDTARPYAEMPDELLGGMPTIPRARALRVEIGVFCNQEFELDTAHITSISVKFKLRNARTGTTLAMQTLAGPFNVITEQQWEDGAHWHAGLELSEMDMAFDMAGANQLDLWMVVTAVTTEGIVTLTAGQARMIEDGGRVPMAEEPSEARAEEDDTPRIEEDATERITEGELVP